MDRREFLKRALLFGGTAAVAGGALVYFGRKREEAKNALSSKNDSPLVRIKDFSKIVGENPGMSDIVIASATNLERNLRLAIRELGGIERFMKKGDKVLLKPNLLMPREPEYAVTTNPELIGVLTTLFLEAGASEVAVGDNGVANLKATFEKSGIGEAASRAGAKVIYDLGEFVDAEFNGLVIKRWKIFKKFLDYDRVINVPIMKDHALSRVTIGMKNWFGVIGGERGLLHQDIHGSIVDLAATFRPTLTVVDGIRVLMRNGPSGGRLDFVKRADTILLGTDQVALDTLACRYLEVDPSEVASLSMAEKRGIGTMDLKKLKIKEIS